MNTLPLILSKQPVPRASIGPRVSTTPSVAVVYSTGEGEAECIDGGKPLSWTRSVFPKYRWRYEVDRSHHYRTVEMRNSPLPAKGEIWTFRAVISVGFYVSDPAEVVRRNVTDALSVVYGYLIHALRPVTRQYNIEDSAAAEAAVNATFRGGVVLQQGITIFACSAQLKPDEAAERYLQDQQTARRTVKVEAARQEVRVQQVRHEDQTETLRQAAALNRQTRELKAMAGRELNLRGLVELHLARNPHDTLLVANMLEQHEQAMLERRDTLDQRSLDLFQYMVAHDLVQPVDIDRFRDQALGQLHRTAEIGTSTTSWTQPPVQRAPAAVSAGSTSVADPSTGQPIVVDYEQPPGSRTWVPTRSLLPVYLVVDESEALVPVAPAVVQGIDTLYLALQNDPQVSDVVRLAMVGLANDAVVRQPLDAVRQGTSAPRPVMRTGTKYASAFAELLSCLPRDIERLKIESPVVRRPVVFFLSASRPDDDAWPVVRQQLVDRTRQKYAPNIIACGIGEASPAAIACIATLPQCAFITVDGTPLTAAVDAYFAAVRRTVLGSAKALIAGEQELFVDRFDGFRPAGDQV